MADQIPYGVHAGTEIYSLIDDDRVLKISKMTEDTWIATINGRSVVFGLPGAKFIVEELKR